MRGSALRPPGLCLPLAHLRHRGARANAGHRALAGHAPMRTGGGRPGGAGGISRPFFGAGCLALVPTEDLQPIVCNKNTHAFLPNFQQIITEQANYYSTFALRLAFLFTPANVSVDYIKNTVFCENCEKM